MRLLLLAALVATAASAQTTTPPTPIAPPETTDVADDGALALRAHPLDGAVAVDGVLDEAAWAEAPVAAGFVQRGPTFIK